MDDPKETDERRRVEARDACKDKPQGQQGFTAGWDALSFDVMALRARLAEVEALHRSASRRAEERLLACAKSLVEVEAERDAWCKATDREAEAHARYVSESQEARKALTAERDAAKQNYEAAGEVLASVHSGQCVKWADGATDDLRCSGTGACASEWCPACRITAAEARAERSERDAERADKKAAESEAESREAKVTALEEIERANTAHDRVTENAALQVDALAGRLYEPVASSAANATAEAIRAGAQFYPDPEERAQVTGQASTTATSSPATDEPWTICSICLKPSGCEHEVGRLRIGIRHIQDAETSSPGVVPGEAAGGPESASPSAHRGEAAGDRVVEPDPRGEETS